VPRHTFSAVLGAVTAVGRDNAETFQIFRPGFDVAQERQRREAADCGEHISDVDLYPDVRPCLVALKGKGLWLGIAGNQTRRAAELFRALDLPVDQIVTSGEWGVAKPQADFFDRIIAMAPGRPEQIVYVGDHRDNDIAPAKAAGLRELSRWVPGATSFNDRGTVAKFDSDHHIVNHHGRGAKGGAVIRAFRARAATSRSSDRWSCTWSDFPTLAATTAARTCKEP
jgi:FMN phosphatase YigB (HAD superfamily)